MRILLCGGAKTQNIIDGISKKFTSGGIEFLVVKNIEEIEFIFARGEYYDRAIIIEQGWTHDYQDNDENILRGRLNIFAKQSAERSLQANYIFLTTNNELAKQVDEEILPIRNSSAVLVYSGRYTVGFFIGLITTDLGDIPEQYLYQPKIEGIEEIVTETEIEEDEYNFKEQEIADISQELLQGDDITATAITHIDTGVEVEREDEVHQENEIETLKFDNEEVKGQLINDSDYENIFGAIGDDLGGVDDIEIEGDEEEQLDMSLDISNFDKTYEEKSDEQSIEENELEPVEEEQLDIPVNIHKFDKTYEENEPEQVEEEYKQEETNLYEDIIPISDYTQISDNEVEDETTVEKPVESQPSISEMMGDELYKDGDNDVYSDDTEDDDDYEEPIEPPRPRQAVNMSNEQIKATFQAFANRGNSIVVTGCGGCGTSTVAFNLANTIANIGYTVLLVDMDTEGKAQSYISEDSFDSMDPDGANLMQAINASGGINQYVSIVKEGFNLLTMGLSSDTVSLSKIIKKDRLARFVNLAKTSYNFVIYDIPFKDATDCASDVTFMTDNLVVVTDSNNWGITKTMLNICNISSDDMMDTVFSKGQILFNRYRGYNKVMGKKVKSPKDILTVVDKKVRELVGVDTGFYFSDMHICGVINDDIEFECGWYNNRQYSDTAKGQQLFIELLQRIVLKG